MRNEHVLKILPEYFREVAFGIKKFEIRKNDRNFIKGDIAYLKEFDGQEFTGRYVKAEITYITDYEQKEGFVVFGIDPYETELDDINDQTLEFL